MNRQIKFRVWDNQERRFRASVEDAHFRDCYLHLTLNGGVVAFNNYGDELDLESDRFTTQQFTGLKDKNGREVYEGDIVKLTFPNTDVIKKFYKGGENSIIPLILEKVEALTFTGLVTFDGGEGILSQFTYFIDNIISFWALKSLISSIEIVGNIFENPELL